jgi:LmbE family N-acetylglucosaminyl deacetylase
MPIEEFGPCERVLVVAPHPDDAEVGCAGTAALLAREGVEVYYLIATNGDKGTEDPDLTNADLARTRAREQRAAAEILGVKEVTILDHGDGELEDGRQLLGEIVFHIRRVRPDIVLTTDPFRTGFYIHRDHRITGMVTMDAVFPFARDRLHFPEHLAQGLTPHKTAELYFWGTENPDVYVDITETIDLKTRATMAHTSQFGEDAEKWMRRWAARTAEGHGMEYAEEFRRFGISQMARFTEEENA